MANTLDKLITEQGERSTYDAVSQCSRCGYCEQACPTYVVTGKEHFSGRGRNQIARMLLEGKFKDPQAASEALSTCLLCGACTSACYAHVPTADIVLEGRRILRGGKSPLLARLLRWLMEDHPAWFVLALKSAYALKRWGLARAFARTRVLDLAGLGELALAETHVEEAPRRFLFEMLREDVEVSRPDEGAASPRWLYFAPCGPNFLYPRVGLATVKLLKGNRGAGRFLDNPCCGLLFYNYGDLDAAKRFARRNIENAESVAGSGGGDAAEEAAPIVGDCSSCVAHLKSYPQLFLEDPSWKARAEAFSRRVRDVLEVLPQAAGRPDGGSAAVAYHDSCRARHGQGIADPPRVALKAAFDGAYRELPEAGWCCGGAGAFAFSHPELSEEVLKARIGHIASVQARVVATSSTSCLLQLAHGLRKYYPECRVAHVSELLLEKGS